MYSFSELSEQFEAKFRSAIPEHYKPISLYEPCRYFLSLGGKRVRPVLCLMANELFTEINDDAWHAATAIELFHNFTLIHDDIMDKAPLRRGKATLHTKYGLVSGILCGDVMNIIAYQSLASMKNHLSPALQLFNQTAVEVCEGQQMDMDFENRQDVSIDEYIEMIALKTSVLLACSLKLGAIAGGALGDNANKLYQFGKNLGIAFQLQDDYLDAFGNIELTGKQNGGDILANKKTFLLLTALNKATPAQGTEINSLLLSDTTDKVDKMLSLFSETGADLDCRNAVSHYSQLAFDYLESVAIPEKRKQPLLDLAKYLLHREK